MEKIWRNLAYILCIIPIILYIVSLIIIPEYSRYFLMTIFVGLFIARIIFRKEIKNE